MYMKMKKNRKGLTMTKEEYVNSEVESSYQDHKFISQVLYEFFWDNIKDLSEEEFKEYLIERGYDIEEEQERKD